jgi:hypothetical protein
MAGEVGSSAATSANHTCTADPAKDAAREAASDPALAVEAKTMLDASRQMGVVNVGRLEQELGQVARQDLTHAQHLFGQMLPQLSTGDLHALSPSFKEQLFGPPTLSVPTTVQWLNTRPPTGEIRAMSGTDLLGSSANSLMRGDLAGAGGLFRMGSKVVLGEVFGQWSLQPYSPLDAGAAAFSTRVIGKGGAAVNVGLGATKTDQSVSLLVGRGLGFSPTSPKAAAAELLQPQNYAAGLLSGVTLKMEIPPIWATSPELPFHNLSLRAKMDTSYGSISVSPQAKAWGLGLFPGRVAAAGLLSAGVASDGMPTITAAGFLGALPPAVATPKSPTVRAFAGVGAEIRNHSNENQYQKLLDLLATPCEERCAASAH